MATLKRLGLFIALNILVVTGLSALLHLLGLDRFVSRQGLDLGALAGFCLVWGMGGALISLALSRFFAKLSMGVRLIDPTTAGGRAAFVHATTARLAAQAGLPCTPEVGIYEAAEINAFATGPTRARALVAVSSGLLATMSDEEVHGVLAHEVSHIANGDMITMTLLQGVVNAFAMFLARAIAWALTQGGRQEREGGRDAPSPMAYFLIRMALEALFVGLGMLVVAWFSRQREFRADAGGARLAGTSAMVAGLRRLQGNLQRDAGEQGAGDPATAAVRTLQIFGRGNSWLELLSTHPPLAERIARLARPTASGLWP